MVYLGWIKLGSYINYLLAYIREVVYKMALTQQTYSRILPIVLVVAALFVLFNLIDLTGQAVKSGRPTEITVSQTTVAASGYIQLTITPGTEHSKGTVQYYKRDSVRARDNRMSSDQRIEGCSTAKCSAGIKRTVNFNVPRTWNGKYCAKVYDYLTRKDAETCFTVK